MRSWLVLGLVALLAGCTDDAGPGGPDGDDGGPDGADGGQGGEAGQEDAQATAWSDAFDLDFTMAASGQMPQEGENCVGGEFEGLERMWANASWTPDIQLRLVIATDFGGDIVVDETGASPLSVALPDSVTGDQHVTVALMAPEQGSAPAVESTLELAAVVAATPSPGAAACAF